MEVMILEDDLILALSMELMLKKLGFDKVSKCITGEEAIEEVAKRRPDLLLVDIQLGEGISGIEAVKEIQKSHQIPALYVTGNSDKYNRDLAAETNYISYLVKPVTFRELKFALNDVGITK